MMQLSTTRRKYEELKKNPLLFLHKVDRSHSDWQTGEWIEDIKWLPVDNDIRGFVNNDDVKINGKEHALYIVDKEISNASKESMISDGNEFVSFEINSVDGCNLDNWRLAIDSFIIRSNNPDDKFPYIHLLWMMNYCTWNQSILYEAIKIYNEHTIPFIIKNAFMTISHCLSHNKQSIVKRTLKQFGYNYNIYLPIHLKEFISQITTMNDSYIQQWNLYDLIDYIYEKSETNINNENPSDNKFLNIYKWINGESVAIKDDDIISIFSLVSEKTQLLIVKRYFHDIRIGAFNFDSNIISQFKDNKYVNFIRYRYCLNSPDEKISLAVPLLSDCILTLSNSNGSTFQDFNGILDFAIQRCDVTNPNITFGMHKFIPQCNGGAVYNNNFCGFIDYSIVFELDESKFTQQNLKSTIIEILNHRPHKKYFACRFDEEKKPLKEEQKKKCLELRTLIDENFGTERTERWYLCTTNYYYENIWIVKKSDYKWLNNFLEVPMPELQTNQTDQDIEINISQISTIVFEKYIRNCAKECEQAGGARNGCFVIHSSDIYQKRLIIKYSRPQYMRFYPQSAPIVGREFDVYNIYNELNKDIVQNKYVSKEEVQKEYDKRESEILIRKVIESLKKELKTEIYNGNFFELKYNKEQLEKIIGLYYFKKKMPDNPHDNDKCFLKKQSLKGFIPFCAPHVADIHNKVTDLPYFWCRGVECFHNNLGNQILDKCNDWRDYSLYHLIEIIGFPKLNESDAGYEPDKAVKEFIACSNRVLKKFKRLKCRNCGHLMYTDRSSGFNRYNYYSCINQSCSEYNVPVYLNYCYRCKTGLIDSRDSAQCPNGWYICPSCFACCNDEQYQRLAQRYILSNKPIPPRIQEKIGMGHNDKDLYFCHICGTQLEKFLEHDKYVWGCKKCRKLMTDEEEYGMVYYQ